MDERRVVLAAKAFNEGDADAFGVIFDAFSETVYKFAAHRLADENETQEAVSDTFFKMLRHGKLPEEITSLKRWTYSVIRSVVIDAYRSRKTEEDLEGVENSIGFETDRTSAIDDKDRLTEILSYLETINPEHKEILILRIWDDLPYSEIALLVGKTEDNCKKIASRTLEAIRSNVTYLALLFFIIR